MMTGADALSGGPLSLQQRLDAQAASPPAPSKPPTISLCTYNILDARNSRLEAAIRNLRVQNIDVAVLTEMRIPSTAPIHTRCSQGYTVFATYTTTTNQGGVALVCRQPSTGWCIESPCRHGPNVLSCVLVNGNTHQPLIGAYLPPSTLDDLPYLTEALERFQASKIPPILMGDLNVDLSQESSDSRLNQVSSTLATYGLEDLLPHFLQRHPYRDNCTWHQTRNSTIYRSRCDYILGTDRRLFQTVSIRDPRHFSTDHYMLVAKLLQRPQRSHKRYPQGRRTFPLTATPGPHTYVDSLFQAAISNSEGIPKQKQSKRPTWLSPETIRLMDQRCSFRRNPLHDQAEARRLTRLINQSIKCDRKKRTEEAGAAIQSTLNSDDPGSASML